MWGENKAGQAEGDLPSQHLPNPFLSQAESSDPGHTGFTIVVSAVNVHEQASRAPDSTCKSSSSLELGFSCLDRGRPKQTHPD